MEMLLDIATLSRERAPTHRGASIVPSYKVLYMSSICPTANDSNQRTIGTSTWLVHTSRMIVNEDTLPDATADTDVQILKW